MVGVGHMLVFGFGALDLNAILPSALFGNTQFKKVCSVAAMVMTASQFTTCWAVTERVLVSNGYACLSIQLSTFNLRSIQ